MAFCSQGAYAASQSISQMNLDRRRKKDTTGEDSRGSVTWVYAQPACPLCSKVLDVNAAASCGQGQIGFR